MTDAVGEHAAVVSIVVHAPFYFNNVPAGISGDNRVSPIVTRLVIVHAYSSVVTAWATAADLSCFQVRPCLDWFEDGAFRASVDSSL